LSRRARAQNGACYLRRRNERCNSRKTLSKQIIFRDYQSYRKKHATKSTDVRRSDQINLYMDFTGRKGELIVMRAGVFVIMILLLTSCYYDKVEALNPANGYTNPCDTAQHAIYSEAIQSIMSYNCVSCHNSSYTAGDVLLDSYDNVKKYAVNGMLMKAVNRSSGTSPMPPTSPLADCQTQKLVLWINNNYTE
jgi:hypothetical protein